MHRAPRQRMRRREVLAGLARDCSRLQRSERSASRAGGETAGHRRRRHAAHAQPPPPWANKFFLPDIATNREQTPPPVITHNFGEVPHGTLCVHKFTVTNIYDAPMQITEVRKSCTCLDYVPMTKVLQPNETAEFTVTMNTGKFVGLQRPDLLRHLRAEVRLHRGDSRVGHEPHRREPQPRRGRVRHCPAGYAGEPIGAGEVLRPHPRLEAHRGRRRCRGRST